MSLSCNNYNNSFNNKFKKRSNNNKPLRNNYS